LAELERLLPYITEDTDKQLSSMLYEDSASAIIDSHGRSALNCIAASVDLAHAKALINGIATVTVHHCHNRMFVLKALTDRGRCGISVAAYWQNGTHTVTEHVAAIKAGARYPSYSEAVTNLSAGSDLKQTLTIICSSRVDLTASLQLSKGNRNARYISPDDVAENKAHSIEHGIEIERDLWDRINQIGTGILVENNDQSRQGAGY
jgi:hypothetical protein